MLNRNPPDHTRLRRLLSSAFTRRRIEQLAPRIQQITDELLAAMATAARADLIAAFGLPLPITVICELLGIPADRHAEFHEWSNVTCSPHWWRSATARTGYPRTRSPRWCS